MTVTYQLQRKSAVKVDDAAGSWLHEGGDVMLNHQPAGHYASTKRVTTGGTDAQNTAMLTLTLFLQRDPRGGVESITMQGAHDFTTGHETGSVSAASIAYMMHAGRPFERLGDNLVVG